MFLIKYRIIGRSEWLSKFMQFNSNTFVEDLRNFFPAQFDRTKEMQRYSSTSGMYHSFVQVRSDLWLGKLHTFSTRITCDI